MNIGMIGLGKLGLPVSVGIAYKRHKVYGYDPLVKSKSQFNQIEEGIFEVEVEHPFSAVSGHLQGKLRTFNELLDEANIEFTSLEEVVKSTELIFIAVQTPHDKEYEGTTKLSYIAKDFDYSYLVKVIKDLNEIVNKLNREITVSLISTVLPGTLAREVLPILDKRIKLCYNPYFIAMGTVLPDFLHPEFVLLGTYDYVATKKVIDFYETIHFAPVLEMSIESAELTKVAYNTMISTKIAFANQLMEICHHIPNCNVDDVTNALKHATNRLISPKYLTAGMGDGGGCHPRDNIAMSFLAEKLNLNFDFCRAMMVAREEQAQFLVNLMLEQNLNKYFILGVSFKPETKISTGSPALLCANLLEERAKQLGKLRGTNPILCWDPYHTPQLTFEQMHNNEPRVFLIGCKHQEFVKYKFPKESVVIDPHRYIPDQEGIIVIRVGEHK